MPIKKEETNDIVQLIIPALEQLGISKSNIKIDVTTEASGSKRGDVWVSSSEQDKPDFEKNLIALIEAKHRNSTIGDLEWRDAMRQGKEKSIFQGLDYYVVSNCRSEHRYYNSHNDEEIYLDGKVLTKLVGAPILNKIRTQVNPENSFVIDKASKELIPLSETKFLSTLDKLAEIYRSAGLKSGDERIDPTVSFVVLKHISEQENEDRTLHQVIKLWENFRKIASGDEVGDLRVEFETQVELIWGEKSPYKKNKYADFKDLMNFPSKLKDAHFKRIYSELDEYHFHGANFDLFGAIYEKFASQTKKKEFGEFYTRRHITGVTARLLLRKETRPRDLKVCDPACGTGGFLTEAFKALKTNYSIEGLYDSNAAKVLKTEAFWGYDNDDRSVARTKLNMFLVGDGHTHMHENDSLIGWDSSKGWMNSTFDYILANPPMGQYDGEALIEGFDFTNERRYELLFVEKMIDACKDGGQLAIVINDGSLEAPTRKRFRKKLLESCDINGIVSLTRFAFAPYTKEKTYILFIQKKTIERMGIVQEFPIWHYILDYDGFANSDKRYRTKYHDDLPELESLFSGAVDLAKQALNDPKAFNVQRHQYERITNDREISESIYGHKCRFVDMNEVNDENHYNLLSEYHLRSIGIENHSLESIKSEYEEIVNGIKNAVSTD